MEYITQDGRVAYVAPGGVDNFTFYVRPAAKRMRKGARVRGRRQKLWFSTREEAERALVDYARERGWTPSKEV